jgi:hypothetical protein
MTGNTTDATSSGAMAMAMILCDAIVLKNAYIMHEKWYWMLLVTIPVTVYAIIDFYRSRQ